jgi:beta-mannosidase
MALSAPGACSSPHQAEALTGWISAPVPGTAAQALTQAGRFDMATPISLHDQDVWYRTPLAQSGRRILRFDGLATVCEAWLDQELILSCDAMFTPQEVEVEIRPGAWLWLCFRALRFRLQAKPPRRARWRPQAIAEQGLRGVRATALGHVPSWCPPVHAVGPWRPISLIEPHPCDLSDLRLRPQWRDGQATLYVEATAAQAPVIRCAGVQAAMEQIGVQRWAVRLAPPQARPWWPHTHGDQPLYDLTADIGGRTLDLGAVGFRAIRLDRGSDGRDFGLCVNDQPVFCRGANWMPDVVSLASGPDAYAPALRLARDAGFNMVRVSGVTVYEAPAFFQACDALGLLVWQDFMFANFDYPGDDPAFAAAVRLEAAHVLAPIQGSPCLAVLCGGSEVFQQAAMFGLPAAELQWPLFDGVLAQAAGEGRPDTPYVANTPAGGALAFCADAGPSHYYGVGAYERPLEDARRAQVRFATECLAFSIPPCAETLQALLPNVGLHDPEWKAGVPRDRGASWDFEDTRDHYVQRLYGVDPARMRRERPALYLDLGRLAVGEAMCAAFAEWRRAASSCAGALVWTLRDVQPGAGWGLLDVTGAPKAPWHMLRRVLQPLQVLLTDEGVNGLAVHLINETAEGVACMLELALLDETGTVLTAARPVTLPPRSNQALAAYEILGRFIDVNYAYRFGPPTHRAVRARLSRDGATLSETFYFLEGPLLGPPCPIECELEQTDAGWQLILTAAQLQRCVYFDDPQFQPSADWLPLAAGERTAVRLTRRFGASPDAQPAGQLFTLGGHAVGRYGAGAEG